MSKPSRRDDTQHLRILGPGERTLMTSDEILEEVVDMLQQAQRARAQLVSELGEGVKYETQLARDRINKDGLDADLSAIRVGDYFKRLTEFNLLQRVRRAIESRRTGLPNGDQLNPDPNDP
jgi:hypothetical protein